MSVSSPGLYCALLSLHSPSKRALHSVAVPDTTARYNLQLDWFQGDVAMYPLCAAALWILTTCGSAPPDRNSADDILRELGNFYEKTARRDGSFTPGIDPDYLGMSDSAYSDLAPVTYAVTIHKTFGWKLPFAE